MPAAAKSNFGDRVQIGRWVPAPTVLNLGIVSSNVQLTPNSFYRIWSSVAAFFDLGSSGAMVATTSSHPLTAGLDVLVFIDGTNIFLAGIVASGTGVMYISQIDPQNA